MEWLKERWAVMSKDRRVELCSGNHVSHSGSQRFLFSLFCCCCCLLACLYLKMFVHLWPQGLEKAVRKWGKASRRREASDVIDLAQVDSLSIS